MNYYIPSDENVTAALKKVIQKCYTVSSQHRLNELVKKELTTDEKKLVGLSETRLRRLALSSGFIALETHTREGDPHKILTKCPVCESSLKRVKNLTIWGGEVTIELNCPTCGYWTGKKKQIPTRYVFHFKEKP